MTEPRRTPLYDEHVGLGAQLTDFAGWVMPLRYGSETAEHQAVRQAAGLFDLSHMGQLEITGSDAVALVDAAVVSDVAAVPVGKAKYTLLCRADGGILDDLIVYRLATDHLLIVANAANAQVVLDVLSERAWPDATVTVTGNALLAVQGPASADVLRSLTDADLDRVGYYAAVPAQVAGVKVLICRTGYTGEDGFELSCAAADAPALWRTLLDHGSGGSLVPAGLACRDTLRLEAAMPLYGHELSTSTSPFDVGLGRVVALDKQAFTGRETLVGIAAQGTTKRLVGLVPHGRRVPRAGFAVRDDRGPVGVVTSGAPSPTLGHPIALALLDREPTGPLAIDIRGRSEPADQVPLPFYKRPRPSVTREVSAAG